MSAYTATATREGRWWVIEVPGVGVTQARNLREAREMAADLVSIMREIPIEQIDVAVVPSLPDGLSEEVSRAREAVTEAELMQREAAELSRNVVKRLAAEGSLTGTDIAQVMGVSAQRVSQLARGARSTGVDASRMEEVARKRAVAGPDESRGIVRRASGQ